MAKTLSVKLPKRIAGVKIPKKLRKGGLAKFLNSSSGQLALAELLVLVAGALAARRYADPDSRSGELLRHPIENLKSAGRGAAAAAGSLGDGSSRVSHALHEAMQAFRNALHEEGLREEQPMMQAAGPSFEEPLGQEKVSKKKRASEPEATDPTAH